MKCKVCGRTKDEIKEEFDMEEEIKEHQGIEKCGKCIREYQTMTGGQESDETTEEALEEKDWKKQVVA